MKVILYRDVPNLGEEGDVKNVTAGYARNFLIPKKFAVPYNKATKVELMQKQQAINRRKVQRVTDAAGLKSKIEEMEMEITAAAGEQGRLFGSVTSIAIVDYLLSHGMNMDRKKIELPEGGIKNVGIHNVKIKLYGDQSAELRINVIPAGAKRPEKTSPKNETPAEDSPDDEKNSEIEAGMDDAKENNPNEADKRG